jgi:arabinosyltransferase
MGQLTSVMPQDPESCQLPARREMVARVAVDNTVMVTWANLHYLDFVINWVEHVRGLGITSYLVGAMDDDILKALVAKGVNAFAMGSGLSLGDFGWGSPTFHKMVRSYYVYLL